MPKVSRPHWLDVKTYTEFVQSHEPVCMACGVCDELLTIDHIIPRHSGGDDSLSNLQWLCIPCNSRKSDRPDGYWSREFFFDQRPNFANARVAQKEGYNKILAYPEFFGQPFSQFNRLLYLFHWVTGSGKTLESVLATAAFNHVALQQRGPAAPRADRILILAKEVAIREQLEYELRTETVDFGLYAVAPRIKVFDWRTAAYPELLETADIWLACLQTIWDSISNLKETERLRLLARFPIIHFDEPHWAADQVAALVTEAWSSLCLGYTASPITGGGKLLKKYVLLHQYSYDDAVQHDSSVKYVAPTTYPYIFKELDPNEFESLRGGHIRIHTDVSEESDYGINLRPAIHVAMEVVSVINDADKAQVNARHELFGDAPTLADHRTVTKHLPGLAYPLHGLVIIETIKIAELVAQYLNEHFDIHRASYPREQGWHTEVVHSGDTSSGVKKYEIPAKPLSPNHPWLRARRLGHLDAKCSRILLVVDMGREGMNNSFCGVTGLATPTSSLIELIQRVIGRQIRAVVRRRLDSTMLDVPDALFDQIRIVTHRTYNVREKVEEALDFVLNMEDSVEGLPTVEQVMNGDAIHVAVGLDDDSYLPMKDKLFITCTFGDARNKGIEFDPRPFIDKVAGDNPKKAKRIEEWVDKCKTKPSEIYHEITQGRLRCRGVILREDLRVDPSPDDLKRFLYLRDPELARGLSPDDLRDPLKARMARGWFQEHHARFIVGSLQPTTDIHEIRRRVAQSVYAQFGSFIDASDRNATDRCIHQAVAIATRDVLGVRDKVEKGGRYDRPEVHAIMQRTDVQREMVAFARTALIRAGYVPSLKSFIPPDAVENADEPDVETA